MISAPRRLLVVDDDRDFADSLGDVLGMSGYEVEVVHSGEAAIRRCAEHGFDLVLMDVRMPGKDGVASFMEIRAADPHFRVILMTANPDTAMLENALAAGARAVVGKPLAPDDLVDLIELHRHRCLVLVVDDDDDFASSIAATLEQAGYAVSLAADGATAVRRACAEHPDAIVLDLRLPHDSGLDIYRELERRDLQAPTVIVSAWIDEEADAVRALRMRAVAGVLRKPFSPDALLRILADIPRATGAAATRH